jgi:hypothetical protein
LHWSAKKKKYTIKTLIFVDKETLEVIAIAQCKGRTHDFKLYKDEFGKAVADWIKLMGDSGFQGILEFHKNSETPKKKSKKEPLTAEDKAENKRIAQERIFIENVNASLKIFKILSSKYRNRRKRFALRMSLICGIYNSLRASA